MQQITSKKIKTKRNLAAALLTACMLASACSTSASDNDAVAASNASDSDSTDSDSTDSDSGSSEAGDSATTGLTVFDSSSVHTIEVDFDEDEYAALIDAYQDNSEKEWISATVTIDGSTYEEVGLRLKGNSSLRSLATGGGGGTGGEISEDESEGLPWLIRLDKYVDDQTHDGVSDFVVRSNSSETSLNEAVALQLLEEAGLATEQAISVRFSINGGEERLRLVIENPDDVWMAANFDSSGALYKAESTGDYGYHGADEDDYDEVFDQEAGKDNTDLEPLIGFLDFINNSDDETFASELGEHLDVEAFAVYLAMQEIVNNFDDIDGPGNNSYLYFDAETEQFTVVPWDYNLAFGGLGGGGNFGGGQQGGGEGGFGGGQGRPGGGEIPEGFEDGEIPEGFEIPDGFEDGEIPEGFEQNGGGGFGGQGGGGFGGLGGSNILVERFNANADFAALYEQTLADLNSSLVDSGLAESIVAEWVAVLEEGASDLVDLETIASEADAITGSL